jgi:hypothetical protein
MKDLEELYKISSSLYILLSALSHYFYNRECDTTFTYYMPNESDGTFGRGLSLFRSLAQHV